MKSDDLILELGAQIDPTLAKDLVSEYMEIQNDCKTGTFGRNSAGKFIETIVQVMQFLEKGSYDKKPNVDSYLKNLESSLTPLNDDLKVCCSRVARSCYTFRNKRSIAHKGSVDPNTYDLKYIYTSSQWILSEIVRQLITSDRGKTLGTLILTVHYLFLDQPIHTGWVRLMLDVFTPRYRAISAPEIADRQQR